jgi:hypothetical protein
MPQSYSPALPIAYVLLQILTVLNWLLAAAMLVLIFLFPAEEWILSSLDLKPGAEANRIIFGLHAIAGLGVIGVPLNHLVLTRLTAMIDSVRRGDPFIRANALRLRLIAWVLLGLQILGLIISGIAETLSRPGHPIDIDAGPSISGWLAVLLTFVLARVFAEGALMREDLEATI